MWTNADKLDFVSLLLGLFFALSVIAVCHGQHTVTLGVEVCGVKAKVEWCYIPEAHPPKVGEGTGL